MKGNELVWRTVADFAFQDRREWNNVDDLAHRAGVPSSSAAFALKRLTAIGAVEKRARGGFFTVNPEKVLIVLAAWRNLEHDTIARTTSEAAAHYLGGLSGPVIVGGAEAAIFHIDPQGMNTVADIGLRVVYVPPPASPTTLPHGDDVLLLVLDKAAERDWWQGYTSRAQTYADLFALPGWQAEEFRRALHRSMFEGADWDQRGESWSRA